MSKESGERREDDRGLSPLAFAGALAGAFASVAGFALVGGWVGLAGIAATVTAAIAFGVRNP
ncbi:hypothetical protein [Actinacidiphila glaucinigra]